MVTDAVVLAQGVQIEAKAESKQTVSDLQPGTEYVVVVAVQNGPKQKSATLEMTTVEPQIPAATISVTAGEATENAISFTIVSADATNVAYIVTDTAFDHELSAEEVLAETCLMLQHANPTKSCVFRSNHASNYVSLRGNLPEDKEHMLGLLKRCMEDRGLLKDERFRML